MTFTATVTVRSAGAGTPTGTVTFKDGATTLGTGTLNGAGVATFTTAALPVGHHTITAVYGGDASFNGEHVEHRRSGGAEGGDRDPLMSRRTHRGSASR